MDRLGPMSSLWSSPLGRDITGTWSTDTNLFTGFDFRFQVSGFKFRVSGFVSRVLGLKFRVPGSRFRVPGSGFRV